MALHIKDRWLWLGLGAFTFLAIKGVSHGLRHIHTLTTVHRPPPTPAPSLTEDAIKTTSLQILATCSNIEIRHAATALLCRRIDNNPNAMYAVLRDAEARDPQRRHRARRALELLNEYGYQPAQWGYYEDLPSPRWRGPAHRDVQSSDPTERDLRRRRREAVVVHEGDAPLGREDVWMRDGDGRMGVEAEEQEVGRRAIDVLEEVGIEYDEERGAYVMAEQPRERQREQAEEDILGSGVWRE